MHTRASFDYAVLRVVPRVDRQEFVNVGVIVLCREHRYLSAQAQVDKSRLTAIWSGLDVPEVALHIQAITRICEGDDDAGPIARLSQSERFHWLTSPRSTVIQTSPVHTGICSTTDGLLKNLYEQLVG